MSYPPPPDAARCTRTTKAGDRCRLSRLFWGSAIPVPDPHSCRKHLNTEERAAFEADEKPRREAFNLLFDTAWTGLITSDPACWSWPPPTDADLQHLRESHSQTVQERLDEKAWRDILMGEWHAGRCAICGHAAALVEDHDHQTGLIRGRLCRSCNTLEGMGHGGVFAKYRERNPATICGVKERYWNPFTREYAEPAPPSGGRWKNHPMRGVGL